jgi:uncharacterized membrane protein YphA (DoxX/SURF4 family)
MIARKNGETVLRVVLGLVVFWESVRFAVSAPAAHSFARIGLPFWVRPVLGGSEALAALLFLLPAARPVGGYALLCIFAIAALIHVLHGDFEVGALVVYGAAVMVCMSTDAPHE